MENYDGRESMSDRIEKFGKEREREREREREKTTEGSVRQENDDAEMN